VLEFLVILIAHLLNLTISFTVLLITKVFMFKMGKYVNSNKVLLFCDSIGYQGFHGVTVSTLDSESCDPSSNLGGT
jgi:hypothetical protein